MALVNQTKREINAKIVFFGPGLSGKATNLRHIHGKLKPEFRGAIKAMSVQDARMLFFDFTPPGDGNVLGYRVRFHVYTVSGPSVEPAPWKMVLKGVDGVVFVADADPGRAAANRESMEQLAAFLKGYGQSLSTVPVVIQYNKTDLKDAQAIEELERTLNPGRLPSFRASSLHGDGVLQTLLGLVKTVLGELRAKGLDGLATAEGLQGIVEPPPGAASPPKPPLPEAAAPARPRPLQGGTPEPAEPAERPALAPPAPPAAPAEEPLSLELAGAPRATAPGQFTLPLVIRSGQRSRTVQLTIALTLDQG